MRKKRQSSSWDRRGSSMIEWGNDGGNRQGGSLQIFGNTEPINK